MIREYLKYRDFIRHFKSHLSTMKEGVLYEIVGGKGETKGFFSLTDPHAQNEERS